MPQQTILDDLTVGETLAIAEALCRRGSTDRAFTLLASALATLPDRTDIRVRKGIAAAPTRRTGMMLDIMAALDPFRTTGFVSDGLATWLKILPFFEDPRFMEIAARRENLLPIPNWHWNLQTVLWAARQVAAVPGDFVELGVFRGHTTLFVAD